MFCFSLRHSSISFSFEVGFHLCLDTHLFAWEFAFWTEDTRFGPFRLVDWELGCDLFTCEGDTVLSGPARRNESLQNLHQIREPWLMIVVN
jgi:hypothetical protein